MKTTKPRISDSRFYSRFRLFADCHFLQPAAKQRTRKIGAGEGNRTLASGMGGPRSTIELHPLPERTESLTAVGEGFKGGVGGRWKFSWEFEVFRFKFQGGRTPTRTRADEGREGEMGGEYEYRPSGLVRVRVRRRREEGERLIQSLAPPWGRSSGGEASRLLTLASTVWREAEASRLLTSSPTELRARASGIRALGTSDGPGRGLTRGVGFRSVARLSRCSSPFRRLVRNPAGWSSPGRGSSRRWARDGR